MSTVAALRDAPATVGERWRGWRNRLIASPGFQRWAASFPLTRRVAQTNARALFDLCAGFVYSQILLACVRLDVFARLADGPKSSGALAPDIGLSVEATERLLRAAASLKLLKTSRDGRFALADLGAALIGNPAIAEFIEHHAMLYGDLADPVALLKGEVETQLSRFWPYGASESEAETGAFARYSALMSRSQTLIAEDVLDAYRPREDRAWLDVGGGEGAFISAVAARSRNAPLMLFDLPPVAAHARAALARSGLGARVAVYEGDFFNDPLPACADVISLVRVLHDHDDESALALLRRICAALGPRGELLVAEPMAESRGVEPVGDAYFGFYLLAMGRGRARSPTELAAMAKQAGFARVHNLKTRRPLLTSALIAAKV